METQQEIAEKPNKRRVLLPLTEKANNRVEKLQEVFFKKTGGSITKVNLINKLLETATL